MLLDSVTVLLHRLGVAYVAMMNPVFRVRRSQTGELLEVKPAVEADDSEEASKSPGSTCSCRRSVNRKALAEAERLLPSVVADARQVALDSLALSATLHDLASELETDPEARFPGPDRKDVADLLRWLSDGNFVLLGYQRCTVSDGQSTVDESSRLGVLRFRAEVICRSSPTATTCWCWRRPRCPASCATAPTRTSW